MQPHLKILFLLLSGLGLGLLVIYGQKNSHVADEVDLNGFPVLDYLDRKASDAKRQAKSKKFNNRRSKAIDETSDQISYIYEWESGLPAIPVERSAAIVVGEVTKAEAFLSEDETNVYSEFTIKVDVIFKSEKNVIKPDDLITAQRLGGRVRFPSGKIMVSQINGQDMPKTGSRYAFFLTHEFPTNGVPDDGLFILTAYEIRGNQVFPLDKVSRVHPISAYKGTSINAFLEDVVTAVHQNP